MLERLEHIPWSLLHQAHGPATHVPAAIRGLCAPEEAVRRRSYWQLDNHVVVQGDLSEAAAYVPAFLIELLANAPLAGIDHILNLLFEIGNGAALPTHRLRFHMASTGEVTPYHAHEAPTLAAACRTAVRAGIPIYLALLETHVEPIRTQLTELLESLEDNPTA